MILVEVLSFFVISCIRQIKVIYLISYKTSLEKVKNGEIKEWNHMFIACFKPDTLGFLIEKNFFAYLV